MSDPQPLMVIGPDREVAPAAPIETLRASFRHAGEGLCGVAGPRAPIHAHAVARYADFLVLLDQVYRLLPPGGEFTLTDRFLKEPASAEQPYDGYHPLPWLLSLAGRIGFEQVSVRPLAEAERHLEAEVVLRRAAEPPRWRVGHIGPGDFPAVSSLFQRVFGGEMSAPLWHWKYGEGRGQGAAAWSGDTLVGHYGGLTRRILYFGRRELACQVADVMVEQGERGVLTRKGPFFLTGASLPEACSGYASKHLIGFGFPNSRAMRLPEKLGLYAEVGRVLEMAWRPREQPQMLRGARVAEVEPGAWERVVPKVERLWQGMQADFRDAIIGERDPAWLRYRYLSHPFHRYRLYLVTQGWLRRPLGLIVLREVDGRCELLDLVGRLSAFPRLIAAARGLAARFGASELFTWASRPYLSRLEQDDCVVRDLEVSTPTSIWTPAPPPEQLQDRWFLMSGDTDFH